MAPMPTAWTKMTTSVQARQVRATVSRSGGGISGIEQGASHVKARDRSMFASDRLYDQGDMVPLPMRGQRRGGMSPRVEARWCRSQELAANAGWGLMNRVEITGESGGLRDEERSVDMTCRGPSGRLGFEAGAVPRAGKDLQDVPWTDG